MNKLTIVDRLLLAAQALHAEMIVYQEETQRLHKLAESALKLEHFEVSQRYANQCASAVAKWQDATDKFQKVYRYAETFSLAVMQA